MFYCGIPASACAIDNVFGFQEIEIFFQCVIFVVNFFIIKIVPQVVYIEITFVLCVIAYMSFDGFHYVLHLSPSIAFTLSCSSIRSICFWIAIKNSNNIMTAPRLLYFCDNTLYKIWNIGCIQAIGNIFGHNRLMSIFC